LASLRRCPLRPCLLLQADSSSALFTHSLRVAERKRCALEFFCRRTAWLPSKPSYPSDVLCLFELSKSFGVENATGLSLSPCGQSPVTRRFGSRFVGPCPPTGCQLG
jgi:hypothetical protein